MLTSQHGAQRNTATARRGRWSANGHSVGVKKLGLVDGKAVKTAIDAREAKLSEGPIEQCIEREMRQALRRLLEQADAIWDLVETLKSELTSLQSELMQIERDLYALRRRRRLPTSALMFT